MKLSVEKPTITTTDQPVLRIEVDEDAEHLVWAVTDPAVPNSKELQSGTIKCEGKNAFVVPLKPISKAGGFQITVQVFDKEGTTAPPSVEDRIALAVIDADHAFGGFHNPLYVGLTAPNDATKLVDPHRFVDFEQFINRVRFESCNTYESRLRVALGCVRAHKIRPLLDLMPAGYLDQRADASADRREAMAATFELPAVELIWNYWQEEGMLVQTLNVILARFENRRLPDHNPLTRFDVTPLLPLRNLLWGFVEAEVSRTTLRRRAAEYEYEYGLSLIGRAVPSPSTNVERRSGFLSAFHQVLHTAHVYFKEADDLTMNADPYPLSQALRDCHLVLSQGSQNQYNEMAVTARAEFLVLQSILAEREMREFLGGRPMTPYPEAWMDRVDSMKSIQGWDDTSVMHYHDLATLGEQLVLTIRMGNWAGAGVGATEAKVWAHTFRQAVQRYSSAYRSVTGVDLTRSNTGELPSHLIAQKVASQQRLA